MKYVKKEGFDAKLTAFVAACQARHNAYFAAKFPSLTPPTFMVEEGIHYIRVYKQDHQMMAFAFVDKSTGLIYKPAGWQRPAKHSRGDVYSPQGGMEAVDVTGSHIRYLA